MTLYIISLPVCTSAVRNCLECRHRYHGVSAPPSPASNKPVNGMDPIQSLIGGSHPSAKVRVLLFFMFCLLISTKYLRSTSYTTRKSNCLFSSFYDLNFMSILTAVLSLNMSVTSLKKKYPICFQLISMILKPKSCWHKHKNIQGS